MNDSAGGAGARRLRGRLQFLLLAVLFFGPLLAAYVMYFYMPHPQAGTNYGELVLPTRPTDGLSLIDAQGRLAPELLRGGRWSLVLLAGRDCNEPCLQRLVMTRQIRAALNEKRSRVQRVLLTVDAPAAAALAARLHPQHPDLVVAADTGRQAASTFFQAQDPAAVYLVDPLGNWLMVYPPRDTLEDFRGIQKDLKKLLRLSQIG